MRKRPSNLRGCGSDWRINSDIWCFNVFSEAKQEILPEKLTAHKMGLIYGGTIMNSKNLKVRIKNVLNYKRPGFWVIAFAIVIISVIGIEIMTNSNKSKYEISINDLFPVTGEHQYLTLKMIEGKYYEDKNPGPYMGTVWEGNFIIELSDKSGNLIGRTDLSNIYIEPMIFNSSFQIQFDDYNNDGDIDFTIGQYASGNGNEYKLFTLRKDGTVEEIPVEGHSSLFISDTTGFYSTKLTKIDNVTFKIKYYDNSKGKDIEKVFKWDGTMFRIA